MEDHDFRALAKAFRPYIAIQQELVDFVRKRHPDQDFRYDRLLNELRELASDGSFGPLPEPDELGRQSLIGKKLDEARRGNEPRFRPLLLKWLYVNWPDNAAELFIKWKRIASGEVEDSVEEKHAELYHVRRTVGFEDPAMREARERIARERVEKTGKLDLSQLPISHVPDQISILDFLKRLDLSATNIRTLASLSGCPDLEELNVSHTQLKSLYAPESCAKVKILHAMDTMLPDLIGLEDFAGIEQLYVWKNEALRTLVGIENAHNLRTLVCNNSATVHDLHPLSNLTKLLHLEAAYLRIRSLSGLEGCTEMRSLIVTGTELTTLSGVEHLSELRLLEAGRLTLKSLRPLLKCRKLGQLKLDQTRIADETSELWDLPELKIVKFWRGRLGLVPEDILEGDAGGNCLKGLREYFHRQRVGNGR